MYFILPHIGNVFRSLFQQVREESLPAEEFAALDEICRMFQNFKNVRLSEQIRFQKQPFQRFRQVQAELCVVILHQAINVVHLRAKRCTIRNYQNFSDFIGKIFCLMLSLPAAGIQTIPYFSPTFVNS